jgi:hypothetical protein
MVRHASQPETILRIIFVYVRRPVYSWLAHIGRQASGQDPAGVD